jgi:hypothetical protein
MSNSNNQPHTRQKTADKFTVIVRVRPISRTEREKGISEVVKVLGENVVVVSEPQTSEGKSFSKN